jgi:hypothetical protein
VERHAYIMQGDYMNINVDLKSFEKQEEKGLSICAYLLKERNTVNVITVDFEKKYITYKEDDKEKVASFMDIYLCHCDRRKVCGKKK